MLNGHRAASKESGTKIPATLPVTRNFWWIPTGCRALSPIRQANIPSLLAGVWRHQECSRITPAIRPHFITVTMVALVNLFPLKTLKKGKRLPAITRWNITMTACFPTTTTNPLPTTNMKMKCLNVEARISGDLYLASKSE